jgi:hypothetical protein
MPARDMYDGIHTFGQLYDHRNALTAALYACVPREGVGRRPGRWKARLHDDGTMLPGYFLVGIELPQGVVTYHVPEDLWDAFGGPALSVAPKWDGHSPDDVVARLLGCARAHADP